MQTLVMRSAKRNGEFIADLASECSQLGELQMMGISGTFLANETRLASHKRKVHLAPLPWRFLGEGEAEVSLIGEGEYIRSARVRISPKAADRPELYRQETSDLARLRLAQVFGEVRLQPLMCLSERDAMLAQAQSRLLRRSVSGVRWIAASLDLLAIDLIGFVSGARVSSHHPHLSFQPGTCTVRTGEGTNITILSKRACNRALGKTRRFGFVDREQFCAAGPIFAPIGARSRKLAIDLSASFRGRTFMPKRYRAESYRPAPRWLSIWDSMISPLAPHAVSILQPTGF